MLLFQIVSAQDASHDERTGKCFVIASNAAEKAQILDILDLRSRYEAMRAQGRSYAVVPHSRLAPIHERAKREIADRASDDPIGHLYAGRYQYSLQVAAEMAHQANGDLVLLRECDPAEAGAFDHDLPLQDPILVECQGWTVAHRTDADDPEHRPGGWCTDNGWTGQIWPPKRYLALPSIPVVTTME